MPQHVAKAQTFNLKLLSVFVVVFVMGIVGGYLWSQNTDTVTKYAGNKQEETQMQMSNLSKANCLADECLQVSDLEYPVGTLSAPVHSALERALQDEYKAYATYEAVIAIIGNTRPFSMIIRSEEQHIASLKALYDKYGLAVPQNTFIGNVTVPSTRQAACQAGVDAEIANAQLYKEELLPLTKEYEDITLVFENLMTASEQRHLPAFERCN